MRNFLIYLYTRYFQLINILHTEILQIGQLLWPSNHSLKHSSWNLCSQFNTTASPIDNKQIEHYSFSMSLTFWNYANLFFKTYLFYQYLKQYNQKKGTLITILNNNNTIIYINLYIPNMLKPIIINTNIPINKYITLTTTIAEKSDK